jgi:hypothetical protein
MGFVLPVVELTARIANVVAAVGAVRFKDIACLEKNLQWWMDLIDLNWRMD